MKSSVLILVVEIDKTIKKNYNDNTGWKYKVNLILFLEVLVKNPILIYQTLLTMLKLVEENKAAQNVRYLMVETGSKKEHLKSYTDDQLMTIKEAYLTLKISRNTLDELRRNGKLTNIFKKRNIRLIHAEVEAAKNCYSLIKGK